MSKKTCSLCKFHYAEDYSYDERGKFETCRCRLDKTYVQHRLLPTNDCASFEEAT